MISIEERCELATNCLPDAPYKSDLKALLSELLDYKLRLDWLEDEARDYRGGVTLSFSKYVEDGRVLEHGYKVIKYKRMFDLKPTLNEAIDSAMNDA